MLSCCVSQHYACQSHPFSYRISVASPTPVHVHTHGRPSRLLLVQAGGVQFLWVEGRTAYQLYHQRGFVGIAIFALKRALPVDLSSNGHLVHADGSIVECTSTLIPAKINDLTLVLS